MYRELSQKLNRKHESIKHWFQYRRAQERKQKKRRVIAEHETQDDHDNEKLKGKERRRAEEEAEAMLPVKVELTIDVSYFFLIPNLQWTASNQIIKEIEESEESDEDEYEILTTTITKSIYVGGPIIDKDGVKVGYVTADYVRKNF